MFCLHWGWDTSIPTQKALESHCEWVLKGRKFFLRYLGEQCFCLISNKVFFNGIVSQHGTEK